MIISDMDVEYLDHMGSDLDVVNAARVSFAKESGWIDEECTTLTADDQRLIKYLAKHNHWSPFAHCTVKFRVKAPIFVARQLVKHTVGFSWNEVSRRYVDNKPEFYIPSAWRKRADNVKQGSSTETLSTDDVRSSLFFNCEGHDFNITEMCYVAYRDLLSEGVCPEQARMVLPQNTMTEWIWTGTLYAWARMCQLRLDKHTQQETRVIAKKINDELRVLFPESWAALMHNEHKEKVCALLS